MANKREKRWAWFLSAVMLSFLAMMSAVSLADESCLMAFSGPGSGWSSLTTLVIPPEKTFSADRVYLTLFRTKGGPLWEGDVARLGLSAENRIVDRNREPALEVDGSIKAGAVPFWAARDWAGPSDKPNYIANTDRNIYTYLGSSPRLTNPSNEFQSSNSLLTPAVLGNPVYTPSQIIAFVRGADVLDEDHDGNTSENRESILGDVLHSRPLAVMYRLSDDSSETVVFFGANDGMLHALLDSEVDADGNETLSGTELWAFIPPDQLHRLKNVMEGSEHQVFIDASPKVYVQDLNGDGLVDGDAGDRAILVCGERGGGTGYFALDITDPEQPLFLWRINRVHDAPALSLPTGAAPAHVIPALGQTWSEPAFAIVRTSDADTTGTPVFFIGAGYSPDNSAGKAILAIRVDDGGVLRVWQNGVSGISEMNYSIPSNVAVVDEDGDGFADKVYVGDLGGQLWRIGKFTDDEGEPLPFPESDENSMNWEAHILFFAGIPGESPGIRKLFYAPSVTLEKDYDLLFAGTGDVEDPCNPTSSDRIYAIKDLHDARTLTELNLVDIAAVPHHVPDLYGDQGWYLPLPPGEKVLAKGLVFNRVYYVTTFMPGISGGTATLYGLDYKTGEPALLGGTFPHTPKRSMEIGTSIPSGPVAVVTKTGQKLLVSKTLATPPSERPTRGAQEAGILAINPSFPPVNFFYLWWMQH